MIVTQHSRVRILERANGISNFKEAKKEAKLAKSKGKTINDFQNCPEFSSYLKHKKNQSNTCKIRIYKNCIFIWRGKKQILMTVLNIPEVYKQEIAERM